MGIGVISCREISCIQFWASNFVQGNLVHKMKLRARAISCMEITCTNWNYVHRKLHAQRLHEKEIMCMERTRYIIESMHLSDPPHQNEYGKVPWNFGCSLVTPSTDFGGVKSWEKSSGKMGYSSNPRGKMAIYSLSLVKNVWIFAWVHHFWIQNFYITWSWSLDDF